MSATPNGFSRLLLLAAASGAVLLSSAGELQARQNPLVGGVVLDEITELPIAGASVVIESIEAAAESREDGRFGYYEVPPGTVTVRVQAPGRAVIVEEVEVGTDDIVFVRFLLPGLAALLSEIVGNVEASSAAGNPAIASSSATAADLIEARLPGIAMVVGGARETAPRVRLRGENSLRPRGGPVVFVDGIRVGKLDRAIDVLNQIPASHVEDVQVLRGPSAAFLQAFASDGLIMVTTMAGAEARSSEGSRLPDDDALPEAPLP